VNCPGASNAPGRERAGIPIALFATSYLPALGQIAQRHPKLRLLIDHMAVVPNAKDAAAFATLPELIALAKYPNVAVKASGAPAYRASLIPIATSIRTSAKNMNRPLSVTEDHRRARNTWFLTIRDDARSRSVTWE
jgi:amidohydrolase family protein